ncbi:hypothetical protein FRC05_003029 [Tulasnella sp. 425]|nr:hypothetical protein FRC05_003029 [Tulasnella sp. 425]
MYFPKRRLPVPLVKRVTKQTLLALDYLHQECSIIHTDLKPHNVMLALSEPNATITAELENSPAETYPPRYDKSLSSEPILTVKSQPLQFSALSDDWSDLNIKLGDFGHASWVDKQLRDEIQPLAFRAPESVFGYPWGTPADIWSLGCLTFEYLAGVCLIPLNDASTLKHGTILDALLARILQTSIDSEYPKDMIDDPSDGSLFFTPEGNFRPSATDAAYVPPTGLMRRVRPGPKTDLAAVLRRFSLTEYEIPPALAFIQRCIWVRPEDRGSAKELLEDPWLHHG